MTMNKADIKFYLKVALALVTGFLVAYPLYLYGYHLLI
jgi:hypothetical protein